MVFGGHIIPESTDDRADVADVSTKASALWNSARIVAVERERRRRARAGHVPKFEGSMNNPRFHADNRDPGEEHRAPKSGPGKARVGRSDVGSYRPPVRLQGGGTESGLLVR